MSEPQGTFFEGRLFKDRVTGLTVRQLTDYRAHSYHLYFTNSGWYDEGNRLLFASERFNQPNFFSVELVSGKISQVSDLNLSPNDDIENALQTSCLNPFKNEVYVWVKNDLLAIDLLSFKSRVLYQKDQNFFSNILNCTADGKYVCTCICEDLSSSIEMDLSRGYVGFGEYWEAMPFCKILRIAVDTGKSDVVFGEKYWISHINTSPAHPHLLTYCHEGPWDRVDHRIWGLDMRTGKTWKIRPIEKGETIGHEYWLADGESIGYHGNIQGKSVFGFIRYDNSEMEEVALLGESGHYFSKDRNVIVCDTNLRTAQVALYRRGANGFGQAHTLCVHRSSAHIQKTHVHPCFSPDGKQVLFTSDMNGYGNLYLVDVPCDIESLPITKFQP